MEFLLERLKLQFSMEYIFCSWFMNRKCLQYNVSKISEPHVCQQSLMRPDGENNPICTAASIISTEHKTLTWRILLTSARIHVHPDVQTI